MSLGRDAMRLDIGTISLHKKTLRKHFSWQRNVTKKEKKQEEMGLLESYHFYMGFLFQ